MKRNFVFVFLFIAGLLFTINEAVKYYYVPQGEPVLVEKIFTVTPVVIEPDHTLEVTSDLIEEDSISEELVLVDNYVLDSKVDLSSGVPIQMVVNLPNGKQLPSSWASPYSYETAPDDNFFDPHFGNTYIYKASDFEDGYGRVPILLGHSASIGGKDLFAANLEYFLRIKEIGVSQYTEQEAVDLFNSQIIGSTVTLCQDSDKTPLYPATMDTTCKGSEVVLQVVGGEVILDDEIWEFEQHVNDLHRWLIYKYPTSNFDKINENNGFLYVFCLGRLDDQRSNGSDRFSQNRVLLAIQVIPQGE